MRDNVNINANSIKMTSLNCILRPYRFDFFEIHVSKIIPVYVSIIYHNNLDIPV